MEPPGGVRLPEALRELALARVEECLLRGMRPQEILAEMSELGATESMRTLSDWMAEVRKRLAEADIEMRDFRRNLRRAQQEARYRMVLADLDEARQLAPSAAKTMAMAMLHRSAAACEQLLMKIDALEGPIKIENTTTIDVRAMSPDQRKTRIDELLAKRAAASKTQPQGSN
jgi:hypothetical protein